MLIPLQQQELVRRVEQRDRRSNPVTFGLTTAVANKPIATAPMIPPIPWHAKTSSVSSIRDLPDRQLATKLEIIPAANPMITAPVKLT